MESKPPERMDERLSASNTGHDIPLLQQRTAVLDHLHHHDGIITQADLHKNHLQQHCGFCGRWIAEAGMIKTHILRVHTDIARSITAELHTACAAFKHLLRRPCRWCERTVHGADRSRSIDSGAGATTSGLHFACDGNATILVDASPAGGHCCKHLRTPRRRN